MSKRYKCIKTYPGSPDLGTILHDKITGYGWRDEGPYCRYFYTDRKYIEESPEFWEEIKDPILKTDDGVDLYKNDYFWHVDPYFGIAKGVLDTAYPEFKPIKGYKHFSTEKAAKDYIEMNKPIYSKKQIMDAALVKYVTGTILLHIKDIK